MTKLKNLFRRPSTHPSPPPGSVAAGIHLSGPNANKTALTVLCGDPLTSPVKIAKVYEKIGAFGTLFSDERLVEILSHGGPFTEVFIDCPLTVPPCVACARPLCPGAVQCDDVAVAYMLAISDKVRRRGARRARPVNPQSQRLWDVLHLAQSAEDRLEPSYSANLAPLVTRARTLQRRLRALSPVIELKETQVPNALDAMRSILDLPADIRTAYRRFEDGYAQRQMLLASFQAAGWVERGNGEGEALVTASVETFQSFLTALIAVFYQAGLTQLPPANYLAAEGWVYLPDVAPPP